MAVDLLFCRKLRRLRAATLLRQRSLHDIPLEMDHLSLIAVSLVSRKVHKTGPKHSKHHLQVKLLKSYVINKSNLCSVRLDWKLFFLLCFCFTW